MANWILALVRMGVESLEAARGAMAPQLCGAVALLRPGATRRRECVPKRVGRRFTLCNNVDLSLNDEGM